MQVGGDSGLLPQARCDPVLLMRAVAAITGIPPACSVVPLGGWLCPYWPPIDPGLSFAFIPHPRPHAWLHVALFLPPSYPLYSSPTPF